MNGKPSSPVLRGLGASDGARLLDPNLVTSELPVILEELKKSLLPGPFQRIADLSVSSRRKLHRAQPLVQQLVFFEKRVTQSFAFR